MNPQLLNDPTEARRIIPRRRDHVIEESARFRS